MGRKQWPLRHSRKARNTILGTTDSPKSWDIPGNRFQTYERQHGVVSMETQDKLGLRFLQWN